MQIINKIKREMKITQFSIYVLFAIVGISCQSKNQHPVKEKVSTIDSTLQAEIRKILEDKMIEINALSGQVILMETKTGEVKAMVGLEQMNTTAYKLCSNFAHAQESGLIYSATLLAALESGKVKYTDTIDTKIGQRLTKGRIIRDHNWHRGGYGKITVEEGVMVSSNICAVREAEKGYGENPNAFFGQLKKMSYGEPSKIEGLDGLKPIWHLTPKDSLWQNSNLAYSAIGYDHQIAQIQILTFYNAIANGGKMVKPLLYKDSVQVINPQIASISNVDSVKKALKRTVLEGLAKPANSQYVEVAGKTGTIQLPLLDMEEDHTDLLENTLFAVEFCGYFPAGNPKYTAIVCINKMGLPVSGGLMAGDVFGKIADCIMKK